VNKAGSKTRVEDPVESQSSMKCEGAEHDMVVEIVTVVVVANDLRL
jgi:hypothetical protein